ncbi:SEP domain [Pseudocohnilembus persalinus]|uniref:SEP domain n=1 Tax=Pseudocohnilembus persalinus TaxID=266149 RepID=A0A0V0QQP1_PSEPJ|nr:SEP domain [Pseudocohnilembus persalinus]|eukprot:KRX04566.1 SEP domain [Pseudocohnilembus persalinus]
MKQGGQLKEKNDCKIVIYQNGFKVNDDEFVPLNEQEMQKFIECLKNSQFPKELLYLQKQYGSDLQPDIELRMEDYRPPTPPKHVAYSGNSVKLGEEKSQAGQVNLEGGEIKVDKSKPTTSIQIRLHNGQTKQIEINIDDRVQTLFDYVQQIAPVQGTFQLIAGFPPKPLKNMNETIEDADLEDTRIQQKLE